MDGSERVHWAADDAPQRQAGMWQGLSLCSFPHQPDYSLVVTGLREQTCRIILPAFQLNLRTCEGVITLRQEHNISGIEETV